jgi:hypothetical protein
MLRADAKNEHPLHYQPRPQEFVMKTLRFSVIAMGAALLMAAPAFAQTKQPTQDGNSPTTVGPGSAAYKQKTQDGNSPTTVGPGSAAYKQKTQDGGSPTMVGPASGAYKQKTQSLSHGDAPGGVVKQN